MSDNDNAIPFSKLVELSGCSEDELLERLAGILAKRPELPIELIDDRPRDSVTGDIA